jgi:hypothetical protein
MDDWRERYNDHLASEEWRELKREVILERGEVCEHCGKTSRKLQLHHKTYVRLGNELLDDLELLCEECHIVADEERASANKQKRFNAALNTYAEKKYGEDWNDWRDRDDVEDEFRDWLETKE